MLHINEYEYRLREFPRTYHLEVGKTYLVSTASAVSATSNNGGCYPWGDRNSKVPVKVTADNERFYTVEVLPHYAKEGSYAISKPYSVTIDKWDLKHGQFKAWEYDYAEFLA